MEPSTINLKARAGRMGGYARAAFNDSRELGRLGQAGLAARWYAAVDSRCPGLAAQEREKRVARLRKKHFIGLRAKRTAIQRAGANENS